AGEVEMRLSGRSGSEKAFVRRVGLGEACAEGFIDLVRRLSDARSDGCLDAVAPGAEPDHRGDRRIRDSGERAAPDGMRRVDRGALVVAAVADVEAGKLARRKPAAAAEEAVLR